MARQDNSKSSVCSGDESPTSALDMYKLHCARLDRYSTRFAVLVNCGSFNPPHIMHMRCLEVAKDHLTKVGYSVMGGYMSPVADSYRKPDLASAEHRINMCRAAADTSNFVMVSDWEARQARYTRTYHVLK